ncbi:EAL domain-containing protein [Bacillus alkalicellulosilyticus]|uniref:EAL domain-containing protein n=1 Tax=Alkalihalobacterium alkalicellulosilyticum TaxID=1912214 RepID=UPI0009969760|nr:EAL domain-containing protein [Bacillus alkalicellulosilyticus]
MSINKRVSLLTPYLDGDYYGRIFFELLQEANSHNSTIITIQARASGKNPVPFNYPVSTMETDGWLLMTNPQSVLPIAPELLEKIESTGKPVVTIGYTENSIKCHSVIIDNCEATKEAILHLIRDHGHRKIAFVGNKEEHLDLIERFEGYLKALAECDIPYDESLVFHASDALRKGGYHAAEAMLASEMDFTAVFASTDLNALAVMEKLQEAGYKVPDNIAVIGFDDLDVASSSTPSLTTIRQPFDDLARSSFDVLRQLINGSVFDEPVIKIQTELITRESCGCHIQMSTQPVDVQKQLIESNLNLDNILKRYDDFVYSWASATREKSFDFSNMFGQKGRWGVLALWDKNEADQKKTLVVSQAFSEDTDKIPPLGMHIPIEQFPPMEWIPKLRDNDFVRVQSIRNERGDWGFIAIVAPIDDLIFISAADITQVSFTVSAASLERDELFEKIESIAEQLEIVSRTTNDGIWDWDSNTDNIQWNVRSLDIFNAIGEELPTDSNSFLKLIHPKDAERVKEAFRANNDQSTVLKTECRICGRNGKKLWVYITGDSISNKSGSSVRIIGTVTNISEKKRAEEQIKYLAFHDGLTGLPNRQLLHERMRVQIEQAKNNNSKLGIFLIDLDRFKVINDTLGHQAGDVLIQQVARLLESTVVSSTFISNVSREKITVSRLGGDEFVILVTDIYDVDELQLLGNSIVQKFLEPFFIQNQEVFTTASIGLSVYPDNGLNIDELLRCADMAMYRAKENGKNQWEIYSPDINSRTLERFTMENLLRKALERDEFILHYQPQYHVSDKRIYGMEALVRWMSPDRGMISPAELIPLAEETGLIIPIGYWILKEACKQTKYWLDQGHLPVLISVNISARQLQEKDFVECVKQILEETALPPQYLCLEITESAAIKNMENSNSMLSELDKVGIKIAIDDFGTGYSSLAMLRQLPINIVKIDSSFIRDMDMDRDDAAIVKAIIAMAHSLELTVTAEGVETEEQRKILSNEKCDYMQGYLLNKPLPSDLAEEVLKMQTIKQ